ncbi:Ig-like domain-containing protein [Aeromicrobium duanguangcaii]|uniref:Ig-like domain-containing protein n=1 Tax=Aeromicrobium duanguangcaii TaxID=2968086 RepID=A0ABY5KF59_9ACTN|nr:Ig-like domain-containing protein [Aeromicrobium duanguangcaii]MCD9154475.1 Ig-like domain-containing protein [Aeromicrobium duanguangcaii]UUI68469.1 Ig-like domain-containing protein [Aeromicrobium duanguangcaii]
MAFRLRSRLLTCATAFTLTALSLAGTMTVLAPAAEAAAPPAFDCTVPRFFAQAEDPVGTVKLNSGSYTRTGGSQWTEIGTYTGANVFNALAFNPTDDYLYGTFYEQSSGEKIEGSFARIDRSGVVKPLGVANAALGTAPNTLWDSGEFDAAGNYFVASGNGGTKTIYKIENLKDVTTVTGGTRPTRTAIPLTGVPSAGIHFADMALLDGYLWAPSYGKAPELHRIDRTTGAVKTFTLSTEVMPVNSYGSAFTMTNGNLALIATNGKMYQIAIKDAATNAPTFTKINEVTAPTNQRSDATNCASALPSKLSVTKTGPATVVVGSTITWRVVVKNEGPGNTSGFVLKDTLPNNLSNVSATSTDTSCVVTGTTQKVATCNGGYLGVGDEAVVTVSATAPSAPGSLINSAQAVGNEDPNPAPPATAETQVVIATQVDVPATVTDTSNGTYDRSSPRGGTITYAGGRYTYTPPAGYSGPDSFTYRTSGGALVTVLIQVTPEAEPDSRTTRANVPVTISQAALEALGHGTDLALVRVGSPQNGAVSFADGIVTFTPTAGFSGTGSFTYTLRDSSNQEITETITVTVTNVFAEGTAVEDGVTTPQNTAKQIPLADVVSPSGKPLDPTSVTGSGSPIHGTLLVPTTGLLTYVPNRGYTGADSFQVRVCDTAAPVQCTTVTIQVTVGANSVTAVDDSATTTVASPRTIDVRGNDGSASGQSFAPPTVTTAPGHGTAVVESDGEITYTPEAGFSGQDTFEYRVCDTSHQTAVCDTATVTVTVDNVFAEGTAVEDGVTTPQNTAKQIPLDDVVSPSGKPLDPTTVTVSDAPGHGDVRVDPTTGRLTYTPNPGYTGEDDFEVRVCDTSAPVQCTTVTIEVTVGANTVTAHDDSATTPVGTAGTIDVRGNDDSASGQSFAPPTVTTAPGHGTAVVESDGGIAYTPAAGFSGQDTFEYRVCDTSTPAVCDTAKVTVTVDNVFSEETAVEDGVSTGHNTPKEIPLADVVSASGKPLDPTKVTVSRGPGHGTVTVDPVTGELTYAPASGYSGDDEFEVRVCDTSNPVQCTTVTIEVTVGANSVTAVDDSATTTVATPRTIDVRGNDDSASGQAFAPPTVTTAPGHGTAVVESDGRITYTPEAGFSGEDTFEYRVCDTSTPTAVCDTATVTVTVDNVFAEGTAVEDGVATPQNTSTTIPLADVVSPSGKPVDPTTVTIPDAPEHGTVTVDPVTGELTYTPVPGYSGDDEFEVRVCDTSNPVQCTTVTIAVEVSANAVAAADDSATTAFGTDVDIDVADNDSSASGQALAHPVIVAGPSHGTAVVGPDGEITYSPDAGFSGQDTFEYRVCDTSTPTPVCDTATVTVTVANAFAISPAAAAGFETDQDAELTIPLGDVVSSAGAGLDPQSVQVVGGAAHGDVSVDAQTGAVTYTPDDGYSGDDAFDLRVCDTSRPQQCHIVSIPVTVRTNTVVTGDDTATTRAGRPVVIEVDRNDSSRTGRPLAAARITKKPKHGVAEVLADGTVRYTPRQGFVGSDSFEYERCDDSTPLPVCDTATVTVDVTAAPEVPTEAGSGSDGQGDDEAGDEGDDGRSPLADTGSGATLAAVAGGLGAVVLGGLALLLGRRRRA